MVLVVLVIVCSGGSKCDGDVHYDFAIIMRIKMMITMLMLVLI